jgi:hypothetical protein
MFCDVLPRSPYPDLSLAWVPSLDQNDIDGGGWPVPAILTAKQQRLNGVENARAALRFSEKIQDAVQHALDAKAALKVKARQKMN